LARLVLCRHGVTEHNSAGRFLSNADPPLSADGRLQCERLRDALAPFGLECCLVSPMRRCLETREIVAGALPFDVENALREIHFGEWEGKTVDWLERHEPERLASRRRNPVAFRPPGGESFEDAAPRLRAVVERIRPATSTLVIGHRGTLGVLERLLRRLPLDSQSVTPLEPGEFRVIY
jgi:broad specificity phosphatase PhoE